MINKIKLLFILSLFFAFSCNKGNIDVNKKDSSKDTLDVVKEKQEVDNQEEDKSKNNFVPGDGSEGDKTTTDNQGDSTNSTTGDSDVTVPTQTDEKMTDDLLALLKLNESNIHFALSNQGLRISESEVAEIKEFTDQLMSQHSDLTTDLSKIKFLTDYLHRNIAYYDQQKYGPIKDMPEGRTINDPYETFKYRKAVCQGYSGLLKIMLNAIDIPALVINGWLVDIGGARQGHAWAMAYDGSEWFVCDPTNNRFYNNTESNIYKRRLVPSMVVNTVMASDENYEYSFNQGVNICNVKRADNLLKLPSFIGDLNIRTFIPETLIPQNVRELFIPSTIAVLSYENSYIADGLLNKENSLLKISVSEYNHNFESYKGVLYIKGSEDVFYIPSSMTTLIIKPKAVYGKNVVTNNDSLTEIIFPEGVQAIENYAFEGCSKLQKIVVPANTQISERAFYPLTLSDITRENL